MMTFVIVLIISLLMAFVGGGAVWFAWSALENYLVLRSIKKGEEETEAEGEAAPDDSEAE